MSVRAPPFNSSKSGRTLFGLESEENLHVVCPTFQDVIHKKRTSQTTVYIKRAKVVNEIDDMSKIDKSIERKNNRLLTSLRGGDKREEKTGLKQCLSLCSIVYP